MKCEKCGYSDNGTGDWAHVCGPVKIKESGMNERIKELMFEAFQSHYGDPITTGAREKAVELVSGWGEKFAELIVRECAMVADMNAVEAMGLYGKVLEHFGVEE